MQVISGQSFHRIRSLHGATFADVAMDHCKFDQCVIAGHEQPDRMAIVRKLKISYACAGRCGIYRTVFEDVMVDGLDLGDGLLSIWGCLFKHVVLRGAIGNININIPYTPDAKIDPQILGQFLATRNAYYSTLDWALDIREINTMGMQIFDIPAHLVRRDIATQAVVTRRRIIEGKWRSLDLGKSWWKAMLQSHTSNSLDDLILVAPRQDPSFLEQIEGISRLREAGIAEPD